MPSRIQVAKRLAVVFKLIAHPDRIRIIEDLYGCERDVSTLASRLSLKSPRISQHLHELKLHGIVAERRDGRHHFYSLVFPDLATWIVDATRYVEPISRSLEPGQIDSAKKLWMSPDAPAESSTAES